MCGWRFSGSQPRQSYLPVPSAGRLGSVPGAMIGSRPGGEVGDVLAVDVGPVERRPEVVDRLEELLRGMHLVRVERAEGQLAIGLVAARRAVERDGVRPAVDRDRPADRAVDGLVEASARAPAGRRRLRAGRRRTAASPGSGPCRGSAWRRAWGVLPSGLHSCSRNCCSFWESALVRLQAKSRPRPMNTYGAIGAMIPRASMPPPWRSPCITISG